MIIKKGSGFFYLLAGVLFIASCSKKIIPDKPFLSQTNFRLDSLPDSDINIPVQINLKPLYRLAEEFVDTVFTSPNWPEGWVEDGCATRYKYYFRRGPLGLRASGNSFDLDFTGFYKIIGSTRICLGGTILSPWTPPCRCGFAEGERRVNVGFNFKVNILPDYKIINQVTRKEPVALDKCEVCFWGQNITTQVMSGMKAELDLSKQAIEDSFGIIDLRPQVQQLWQLIGASYNLGGLGWLKMNPQHFRLNNFFARNDSLNIFFGLTVKPVVSFERPPDFNTLVPKMAPPALPGGFNLFLDAALNYDSLSQILNTQLKDKRFDLNKGPLKKHAIIKEVRIYGMGNEKLILKIEFSGSAQGVAYLTGRPYYDTGKKEIGLKDVDFDIKTKTAFAKTAEWLFNRRIIREIEEGSRFDLSGYVDTVIHLANSYLNREWIKGIRSAGNLDRLEIIGIYPMTNQLIIRSNAGGYLGIRAESIDFKF